MAETRKTMNRRVFLQAAALAGGAVLITACAPAATQAPAAEEPQQEAPQSEEPASTEQVTIAWWNQFSTPTCQEWFPKIVSDFEAQNPNIKIEFEITGGPPGGGDYLEVLLARIAAGDPPDTCTLWDPPSGYGARGAMVAIDEMMAGAEVAKPSAFYEGVLKSCQFKGKTYGLPASAGVGCLFINKTLFEEKGLSTKREDLPKTWNELREVSAKLTSYEGDELKVVGMTPWDASFMLSTWSQNNGGKIFNSDTLTYEFDSDQNIEWFQHWLDWLDEQFNGDMEALGIAVPGPDVYPESSFQYGKLAIATSGAWATTDAGIPFGWELFALPVGPSGTTPKSFYWPNWFAMPNGGAHPQEGFKFVEYMSTEGWATWYTNATIDTPAWKEVPVDIVNKALEAQEGRDRALDLQRYFTQMLEDTADVWTSPVETFANDNLVASLNEVLNKVVTPAEALANTQKVVQAKLDETLQNA